MWLNVLRLHGNINHLVEYSWLAANAGLTVCSHVSDTVAPWPPRPGPAGVRRRVRDRARHARAAGPRRRRAPSRVAVRVVLREYLGDRHVYRVLPENEFPTV